MASFCAKCGAALVPNVQSCSSCGAAAATGGAVAAPAQPFAAPPQSGSSALKIILIIVAIIVGLGILGLGVIGFIGYRIAKNVHVDSGGRMTMNTPAGTVTTAPQQLATPEELGTAIYPGSQPFRGGMRISSPAVKVVSAYYLTTDSRASVVAFYKEHLGPEVLFAERDNESTFTLASKDKNEIISVIVTDKSENSNGKTKIFMSHTTASSKH